MRYFLFLILGVMLVSAQAFADDAVQVTTSKKTYHYGDYLSITVHIQDITSDTGTMYIIDQTGKKSSPIPFRVTGNTTVLDAPNALDPTIFEEGKYKIEIDYEGSTAVAEFELVDIGNVVLPFGSTTVVLQWSQGKISDYIFLKFLIDTHLLSLPGDQTPKEGITIPNWYKENAMWWSDKQISDEEFVKGLQYLVDRKIIAN